MNLSEFSLKRPVTTLMLTICALVVGVVALDRLPIEQLPSISSSGSRPASSTTTLPPKKLSAW